MGKSNLVALVDKEDFDYLSLFKWYLDAKGYAVKQDPITKKGGKMHQLVMKFPKEFIDHINGNTLDNRKQNLRLCNRFENARNRKKNKNGTSKYKGVSWHKRDKIYNVGIRVNNKRIHTGYFKNEIEAAKAYNTQAIKYHGEFAKLNKIKEENE